MIETNSQTAVHIIVHGDVQGVGFRYFTQKNALSLGILGWVQNQYDGTVEIWAEGERHLLEHFIRIVRRGPSHSLVSDLDITWPPPTGNHIGFRIHYV
ncbi:MAG: acylphosphatase [Anaerolineae bacterium]|nr:acylphosphatase [Anaerolineae bacterium]